MRKLGFVFFISLLAACTSVEHVVEQVVEPVMSNKVVLQGDFTQGGMIIGHAPVGSHVNLNGEPLKLSPEGDFVFGLDRDAKSGDMLQVVFPDGEFWQRELSIKSRQYDIQYVTGIDKKIQSKQKSNETWARIKREGESVKSARKAHFEQLFFKQPFKWPLIGPITGVFGSQRVYNGEPGRPHYGVDIAASVGTPVYAPANGTVTLANEDLYYSGGTIILDHGYGISSSFLHLSRVLVNVGDEIKQGDLIAEVGAGGRASGSHLDWRMNWYKRRIDPELLVPPMKFDDSVDKR